MDNIRHLSTAYSQDIHTQKYRKIDIFRHLSPLSTQLIIKIIIINKYILTIKKRRDQLASSY